jgi:hypothetical protein
VPILVIRSQKAILQIEFKTRNIEDAYENFEIIADGEFPSVMKIRLTKGIKCNDACKESHGAFIFFIKATLIGAVNTIKITKRKLKVTIFVVIIMV